MKGKYNLYVKLGTFNKICFCEWLEHNKMQHITKYKHLGKCVCACVCFILAWSIQYFRN